MADYLPAYLVAPNYEPPAFDATIAQSLVKPERAARKAKRRTAERKFTLSRAQVRQRVFDREKGRCQRCRRAVSFDVSAWKDERAQVNENPPRSRGGDPLDPKACELTCRRCHFGGPSGAHAPTAARMKQVVRASGRAVSRPSTRSAEAMRAEPDGG